MHEFISKDGNIILNVDRMDAYIPISNFTLEDEEVSTTIAIEYGEGFKILGLFNCHLSDNPDEDLMKTPLRTFNYPNIIETYPSSNSKAKLKLLKDDEEMEFYVFHYIRGDIIMNALEEEDGENSLLFLKALCAGKLPRTLNYGDVINMWHRNLKSNGINPSVPSLYLQAIIAELYRSKKSPTMPFRKVYGKNMESNDYIVTNMRSTTSYTSVFTSQVFEDMGRMLTTSVNMTRRDIPQTISPIEKTLYM